MLATGNRGQKGENTSHATRCSRVLNQVDPLGSDEGAWPSNPCCSQLAWLGARCSLEAWASNKFPGRLIKADPSCNFRYGHLYLLVPELCVRRYNQWATASRQMSLITGCSLRHKNAVHVPRRAWRLASNLPCVLAPGAGTVPQRQRA